MTPPPESAETTKLCHHDPQRQKLLPFEPSKETRAERVERLLSKLGQPPERITTANIFDYNKASQIAKDN